jgi:putative phosphoribosyl transferase
MSPALFSDRTEAGRRLAAAVAEHLARHPGLDDPVVLALPRGGVPVAIEVARRLSAPLDLVMVRKIGVPFQPELAAGAVVDGDAPETVYNADVLRMARLTQEDLDEIRDRELAEIGRRRAVYLADRAPVPIEGRDAILVDDGVATGATTRAALRAVTRRGPRSVTLAVPVAAADTLAALKREADHAICLETPRDFRAIGLHYDDFGQVPDAEVVRLLAEAEGFARSRRATD